MGLPLLKEYIMEERLYTVPEAVVMIGITETSLFRYLKQGKIESIKINGNTRFTKQAIINFLKTVSSSNVTEKDLELFIQENIQKALEKEE